MEKTRVKRGEKYWYIATDCQGNISVYETEGVNTISDRNRWRLQNYFSTRKEAEQMARKLRAVLNGADVIEMPKVKSMIDEGDKALAELYKQHSDCYIDTMNAFTDGWLKCYDYLQSKIVK